MPKANSRIPASNQVFPNLNPNHALVETPKAKLFHRLREGLRSRQYGPRPHFRCALFHINNIDLFKSENPSPLAGEGGGEGDQNGKPHSARFWKSCEELQGRRKEG